MEICGEKTGRTPRWKRLPTWSYSAAGIDAESKSAKWVCRNRRWWGHICCLTDWPGGSGRGVSSWLCEHDSYRSVHGLLWLSETRGVNTTERHFSEEKNHNRKTFLFFRNTARKGLVLNRCPHWVVLFTWINLAWNRKFRSLQRQSQPWVRAQEKLPVPWN